eukprot:7230850-Pyramimonas_sp.AAC.1
MGGLPMYLRPINEANVPDKIMRLQKTLGGAFNRVWSAWARKAGLKQGSAWVDIKSDPRNNTMQQCDDFLQAWSKVGCDAYRMWTRITSS